MITQHVVYGAYLAALATVSLAMTATRLPVALSEKRSGADRRGPDRRGPDRRFMERPRCFERRFGARRSGQRRTGDRRAMAAA